MSFYNKVKWILGILLVFIIIVTTNLIDRKNFVRVKDAIVTIYEDRLIANDIIYEINTLIHEKQIAVAFADDIFFNTQNQKSNRNIRDQITKYERTKLTIDEQRVLSELKSNLERLNEAETNFINLGFKKPEKLSQTYAEVKKNLYDLAKIQLNEGEIQMSKSKRVIDTVELFTQIEIFLLVALAIIIQIVVMYKPRKE
jgi:hypothetical protein